MPKPGSTGRIKPTAAAAVLRKNTASAKINSTAITPGWKLMKPSSNGVAPPTSWLVSK